MKFKSLLLTAFSIFVTVQVTAQANILNAKNPDEIGVLTPEQEALDDDKPLEYGYVADRDIMYSKMTWEKVILDERVNFPMYFPVDTNNIGKDRRSLYDVLTKAIYNGDIKNIYDDSYFTAKRTVKDFKDIISKTDTLDIGFEQYNAEGFVDPEYIVNREISSYDVSAYLIKGLWYFDNRQAELKFRIIGIAPAAPDVNFIDSEDEANKEPIPLFWIFYPDARDVLHKAKAFNRGNNAHPISFDHLLNSRRFNGTVYKVENVYGDREITEYINDNALMQLIESQNVKESIRDFELDMWTY